MLQDERIETELSKLKKYVIILSVVFGLIFLGFKGLYMSRNSLSFIFCITEITSILSGIVILIGALCVRSETKDELYYSEKNEYYNTAFKIYLFIVFITFGLTLAGTAVREEGVVFSSANYMSTTMLMSLFLGYSYCRYKHIYFNYKIIELNNKEYYKGVGKNILKIIGFFGIIYGIALVPTVFYLSSNILILCLVIFLAFIVSTVSNTLFYLIVSFLEKRFFAEEYKRKITSPTFTMLISALVLALVVSILNIILFFMEYGNLDPNMSFMTLVEKMASISRVIQYLGQWSSLLGILGIVFLAYDLTKDNTIFKSKMNIVLVVFLIANVLLITYDKNYVVLNQYLYDFNLGSSDIIFHERIFIEGIATQSLAAIVLITTLVNLGKYIKPYKSLIILSIFYGIFIMLSIVNIILLKRELYLFVLGLKIPLLLFIIVEIIVLYLAKSNHIEKNIDEIN